MLTRRDMLVAGITLCSTLAAIAVADTIGRPTMKSSVFSWETLKPETTKYGARRAVFDTHTASVDRLECHITTLNPGEIPHPGHQHADEELLIIKEGTLEVQQNAATNQASTGSIIFQASNEYHGLRNNGTTPATYYVIRLSAPAGGPGNAAK